MLLDPLEKSLLAGVAYVDHSEYVRATVGAALPGATCRRVKPPTSLPKSSVTYALGPSDVIPPLVRPPAFVTSPPDLSTPTGATVRLAGARLNASQGPGGAAACAGAARTASAPTSAAPPITRSFTASLHPRTADDRRPYMIDSTMSTGLFLS